MILARLSTAKTFIVGPVLDAAGAFISTSVIGDFKLSKNGGVPAALNASATLTHRHTGHYSLAATASDLDTLGQNDIAIDATVNGCPVARLTVIAAAVYDALVPATEWLHVDSMKTEFSISGATLTVLKPDDTTTAYTKTLTTNAAAEPVTGSA